MKKIAKGVIYIATGREYVEEAIMSAASLKKHMPRMPITIFTDENVKSPYFDRVIKINDPKYGFEDRVKYIDKSPYDYTLYLDTDTYICDDISELFELLNRFDIAAAHAPCRIQYSIKNIPDSFSKLNAGVVLFKKSPKIKTLFSNWLKLYLRYKKMKKRTMSVKGAGDQRALREALYKSNLRIATLTPEYNLRARLGYVNWKVKIIHTRNTKDLNLINKIINSTTLPRIYILDKKTLNVFDSSGNFSRADIASKKITWNRTTKIINYTDHIAGVFGIFLKKNFPKLYCQLKKLKK